MIRLARITGPLAAVAMLAACEEPPPPAPADAPSATAAATATASAAPPPAMAPPSDLDVAPLLQALKCPAEGGAGPCQVLRAYESCKPWDGTVPSGDGRWMGHGYVVKKGKFEEELTLFRTRRVPSSEVGPGQLPVKLGLTYLPSEHNAHATAARAIRQFARHDVPPRKNPAVTYTNELKDWPEFSAIHTESKHVYMVFEGGAFLCTGAKQQLVLIKRAATRGSVGDGLYAELWATSW